VTSYLIMLASAFGLGAVHALEPGHGKTVVAAYLVGSRGRAWDAIVLGGVVTLTHTLSVVVLAGVSAAAAAHFVPGEVQRWLGVGSGILVTAVGAWMIYVRAKYGPPVHGHDHGAGGHEHGHAREHGHGGRGERGDAARSAEGDPNRGNLRLGPLVALGVSGGVVPCPAALLLIPAAVGMGETVKGVVLVISFSLGLAMVLIATGLAVLRAASFVGRWLDQRVWMRRVSLAGAVLITVLGLALTVKALMLSIDVH
jgi:nickel/cobalt exporter